MSGKTFYAYELIDSRNNKVFYVGKGTGKRMYQHIAMTKINRKMNNQLKFYIMEMINNNAKIIYKKILETKSESKAYKKEAELIEYYGIDNLCNYAKAGPNWSDMDCKKLRKRLSISSKNNWKNPVLREKMIISLRNGDKTRSTDIKHIKRSSEMLKKMWENGLTKGFLGRKHSAETKHKMSIAAKNKINPMLNKHHSAETKEKIRLGVIKAKSKTDKLYYFSNQN